MGAPAVRTPAQNNQIWSLCAAIGRAHRLSREDVGDLILRPLCREVSRQDHTSRLSQAQAAQLIARLEERLREAPQQPQPEAEAPAKASRAATITPRQQQVLGALFVQAGMDTPEQQRGFSRRQCGRPWPQTQEDCDAILEGLKAIILRRVTADDLQRRVAALQKDPRIQRDTWKAGFVADLARQIAAGGGLSLTTHKLAKLVECELFCEGGCAAT